MQGLVCKLLIFVLYVLVISFKCKIELLKKKETFHLHVFGLRDVGMVMLAAGAYTHWYILILIVFRSSASQDHILKNFHLKYIMLRLNLFVPSEKQIL